MNECINTHAISLFVAILTQCIVIYLIADKDCPNDTVSMSEVNETVGEYVKEISDLPRLSHRIGEHDETQENIRAALESSQAQYDALSPEAKIKHRLDGDERFESVTGKDTKKERSAFIRSLSSAEQKFAKEYEASLQFKS